MALRLEGKNAIVTGGASGIGRASCIRFAEEGANLSVADRNLAGAEETAAAVRKLGRKALAIEVDTSDPARVEAMVDRTVRELGGVDILLAAAGVSHAQYGDGSKIVPLKLHEKPLADWRRVLEINLDGVFITDQAVARAMIKAAKGGRIINISSGAAKIPMKNIGEYCVSKAGVWMLSRCLALELGPYGITVNAIGPGVIDTPMTADLQRSRSAQRMITSAPLGHIGEPLDVANTALFLASDEGRFYTGSILHPDGGLIMQ